MSRLHARLGPSGYPRWSRCPGSINLCHGAAGEEEVSEFAAEGTAAHEIAEECLLFGFDAHRFVGHTLKVDGYSFPVTAEMADHLQPGLDRIWELTVGGRLYIEQTVDTSRWCGKGNFGTLDRGIVRPDLIVIGDLKYGAGVPVGAVENEQLRIYGLAFWDQIARHQTKAEEFLFIVDQPRIPGAGGEWRCTLKELLAFGEEVAAAAVATTKKDAPLVAGEIQCKWCPAKGRCPEYDRFNLELMCMKFDTLDADPESEPDLPTLASLTPERRSYIVRHTSMLTKWIERLHAETLIDALAGRPTPGLKAVPGRRPGRKWTDEKLVEAVAVKAGMSHDKIFNYSLTSPAQAEKGEKAFPKEVWKTLNNTDFVEQGEAKPVLVAEEDERPAITPITDKFDIVT